MNSVSSEDTKATEAASAFSASDFRLRVQQRLTNLPVGYDGDHLLNPQMEDWVRERAVKDAAVLIPVFDHKEGATVLLTQRSEGLSNHSGQVAFPGGKIDPTDSDAEAAALRESEEEVGLDRSEVEIVGRLPTYHTGSGFRVVPVLGIVRPFATLEINPQEVDSAFEVPLSFLMDVTNHNLKSREFKGEERYFYTMPYEDGMHGERYIWGVTASIIRLMYERLYA